jgi:nucleoside-diphosphate-sugar epimerase
MAYLVGNGQGICNSIYVDNLVACILACARHEGDSSGFFNVSDNETVTWKDFYASLAAGGERDMDHVWRIPGDRFRPSLKTRIDGIIYSPVYAAMKNRIPKHMRNRLKSWLNARIEKPAGGSPAEEGGRQAPTVTREMWELQSTRRKLPNSKFAARFAYSPPVTFSGGVAKTLSWLEFAGMIPPTTS